MNLRGLELGHKRCALGAHSIDQDALALLVGTAVLQDIAVSEDHYNAHGDKGKDGYEGIEADDADHYVVQRQRRYEGCIKSKENALGQAGKAEASDVPKRGMADDHLMRLEQDEHAEGYHG